MILVYNNCNKAFDNQLDETMDLDELDNCPNCDIGVLITEDDIED